MMGVALLWDGLADARRRVGGVDDAQERVCVLYDHSVEPRHGVRNDDAALEVAKMAAVFRDSEYHVISLFWKKKFQHVMIRITET